jgi:hypothetical protein
MNTASSYSALLKNQKEMTGRRKEKRKQSGVWSGIEAEESLQRQSRSFSDIFFVVAHFNPRVTTYDCKKFFRSHLHALRDSFFY